VRLSEHYTCNPLVPSINNDKLVTFPMACGAGKRLIAPESKAFLKSRSNISNSHAFSAGQPDGKNWYVARQNRVTWGDPHTSIFDYISGIQDVPPYGSSYVTQETVIRSFRPVTPPLGVWADISKAQRRAKRIRLLLSRPCHICVNPWFQVATN